VRIPLEARRKVIVRGANWVGDAVMATPALRRLRRAFEGSRITLLVRPWVAAVYAHNPDIDELWAEDDAGLAGFMTCARRLRAERFDFGVAIPNSFRSALLLALGGVRRRVGFALGLRRLLLTRPVDLPSELREVHQVHYYLHLIDWMTEGEREPPELVLAVGSAERARLQELLAAEGIDPEDRLIGLAPGSINSAAKCWLPERFAELADRLVGEAAARVVLFGSPREKGVVETVRRLAKAPLSDLGARIGLAEGIALIERLHALVTNDCGAMHLAAALRVPTVAIFGPTDWRTTGPFSPVARVVRHPVDCSPCGLRHCPIGHPCMKGVQVQDVVKALAELAPAIKARMQIPAAAR